jgi:hypothetical protein
LIVLWEKEKEANNKIRSKDSEKDQRDEREREKRVLGKEEERER